MKKLVLDLDGDIPEAEVRCTCTINKEYKKEIGLDEDRYYNDDKEDLSIEGLQYNFKII